MCITQSPDRNAFDASRSLGNQNDRLRDENQNGLLLTATPILHFVFRWRCDKGPATWHSLGMFLPNKPRRCIPFFRSVYSLWHPAQLSTEDTMHRMHERIEHDDSVAIKSQQYTGRRRQGPNMRTKTLWKLGIMSATRMINARWYIGTQTENES